MRDVIKKKKRKILFALAPEMFSITTLLLKKKKIMIFK